MRKIECIKKGTYLYPIVKYVDGISAGKLTKFATIHEWDEDNSVHSCNVNMHEIVSVELTEDLIIRYVNAIIRICKDPSTELRKRGLLTVLGEDYTKSDMLEAWQAGCKDLISDMQPFHEWIDEYDLRKHNKDK